MKIAVVIPAYNEQDYLPACLSALDLAIKQVDDPNLQIEVVLVLDSCTDHSQQRVEQLKPSLSFKLKVLVCQFECVGAVRHFGVQHCIAQGYEWIACTDADSQVDTAWLVQQLSCQPIDLICGVVEVDDWQHLSQSAQAKYQAHYQDKMGHSHIHGANLSFSVEAYQRTSGFKALCSHEDVDLVQQMQGLGLNILWSNKIRVKTSSRLNAKTPEGFSYFLKTLKSETKPLDAS